MVAGDGRICPVISAYGAPNGVETGLASAISVDLIPGSAGLTIAGRPLTRPFGFEASQDEASMLAIDSQHHVIRIPLQEIVGLTLRGRMAEENAAEGHLPLASLSYEHGTDEDGLGPKDPIIALEGVGLCVYSGYLGRRPTWYFSGVRVGEFDPASGESTYLSFAERFRRKPENFPMPVLPLVRSAELDNKLAAPGRLQATL